MNWSQSKSQIIGAILVITVLAGGTLYSSNIYRMIVANPDKNLFVVSQPDKKEINVIQRTKGYSYNRYKITVDQICQYSTSKLLACYKWDVFSDKLLRRSKADVALKVDETEQRVYAEKTTPFKDGVLTEIVTVFQDHTDIKVSFNPNNNLNHQLIMKVTSLKGSFIPFDFGDTTSIRFDDVKKFVFRWDGAVDMFDHHWFDGKILSLYFKSKAGEVNLG